jgi:hypothetical protein
LKYFTNKFKKTHSMKKLFIVLAVASLGFVACNNEGEKNETADTPAVEAPPVPAVIDSAAAVIDSAAAVIDSAAKQ